MRDVELYRHLLGLEAAWTVRALRPERGDET